MLPLTSALAPLIRLSRVGMLWMALPCAIVPCTVGMITISPGICGRRCLLQAPRKKNR